MSSSPASTPRCMAAPRARPGAVQFNAQQVAHNIGRREELYNDFIERASECYADAFEHSEADVSKIVRLYALVSRMRVVSSAPTTEQADKVVQLIIKTYDAPNKTFHETFHELARDVHTRELDPLRISAKPAARN